MRSAFFEELYERYGEVPRWRVRILKRMAEHGINRSQLAKRVGFETTYIYRWFPSEGAKRPPMDPEMSTMALIDEALEALIEERNPLSDRRLA